MDFNEYEEYFVVPTEEGRLAVDPEVWWQNEVCANERLNILTGEEVYDNCDDDADKVFTTD